MSILYLLLLVAFAALTWGITGWWGFLGLYSLFVIVGVSVVGYDDGPKWFRAILERITIIGLLPIILPLAVWEVIKGRTTWRSMGTGIWKAWTHGL